jgi:methylamine utilization protein MauE
MDPLFKLYISLFVIVLLAGAAFHKFINPLKAANSIKSYGFGGFMSSSVGARAIGSVEFIVATMLLIPATFKFGAIGASVIFLGYSAVMGVAIWQGRQIADCGCGWGGHSVPVSPLTVGRNLVIASLILVLLLPIAPRDLSFLDHINGIFFTAMLLISYNFFEIWVAVNHSAKIGVER